MAHEFWSTHGLKVDVVVVNEHPAGYFDEFQDELLSLIQTTSRLPVNRSGGAYLIRTSQLTPEDGVLLQAVASINLDGKLGSLSRQVDSAAPRTQSERPLLAVSSSAKDGVVAVNSLGETKPALEYENGRGGFNAEGDYLIAASRRAVDAAALVERDRQRTIWNSGDRGRRRIHLGGQQSRKQTDYVVE